MFKTKRVKELENTVKSYEYSLQHLSSEISELRKEIKKKDKTIEELNAIVLASAKPKSRKKETTKKGN